MIIAIIAIITDTR
jgi:hypothetical protein